MKRYYLNSSSRWIKEHIKDKYVKQAKKNGLKSRSWFKIEEIQKKYSLLKSGMNILDLGSSPGSWSEYACSILGKQGSVLSCDIRPMNIKNVEFLQGNVLDKKIFKLLVERTEKKKIHAILSDMSPNISGISAIDIPNSFLLTEVTLKICKKVLSCDGKLLIKIFQGKDFGKYFKKICSLFKEVKISKPSASRSRSKEVYIIAIGKKIIFSTTNHKYEVNHLE